MPNKEPTDSNFRTLRALMDPTYNPRPMTASELAMAEKVRKFRKLAEIRRGHKWEWNAGAKYLYSELIRAYGLDGEWREALMDYAKPTLGRKHEVETAVQIALLKRQGLTARQIAKQLQDEGKTISVEGVESYSKHRRKKSPAEALRVRMRRPD